MRKGLGYILLSAAVTVILWQFYWGNILLAPFSWLAVWFHEMGHGLTAMLLGGNFRELRLYPHGGVAVFTTGGLWGGNLGRALVAAGGPLGPALFGAGLILCGRWRPKLGLGILAGSLLLSFIWLRTPFAWGVVSAWAVVILALASKAPPWLTQFSVSLLGVQACISTYHQIDYLFTEYAVIGGNRMLSDTGQIAEQLLLPYWFWGGLLALITLGLLGSSLYLAYIKVPPPETP